MKVSMLGGLLLLCLCLQAQKKKRPSPTRKSNAVPAVVITLLPCVETVPSLQPGDNGIRALQLPIAITTNYRKSPGRQQFGIVQLDYNAVAASPVLVDTLISVVNLTTIDSLHWMGLAVCNVRLTDSSTQDETFYLVQRGNILNRCAVLVKTVSASNTPAAPGSVVTTTDTPTGETGGKQEPSAATKTPSPGGNTTVAPITLDTGITVVHPVYIKDSTRVQQVELTFYRDADPEDTPDTVTLKIEPYRNFKPVLISPAEIVIKKWEEATDKAGKKIVYHKETIYVANSYLKDSISMDAVAYIRIVNDKKNSLHELRLTDKGSYNSSSTFWMETGSNFDLLDGVKANNLYAGIYMFVKDISAIRKKQKLSFTGGVYESKSSSLAAGSDSGIIYRDATSYSPLLDTTSNSIYYRYYRDTGSVKTTTNVQSIGIFFSPHWRLSRRSTSDYGFHMYGSFYLEMLWQRVNVDYDYANTKRDSVYRVATLGETYSYPFKEHKTSFDYRTQYVGLGLPIYITEKAFSLYINDVVGLCNQRFAAVHDGGLKEKRDQTIQDIMNKNGLTSLYENPKKSWNPFYLLQFRLTEESYGVVFTGEVRGFLLKNTKPVISLSLSKKFDLADLLKAVVKPFSPAN